MPQLYALTGVNPEDPLYLYVHVADDGLTSSLEQPAYRSADMAIKDLMLAWDDYSPQDEEGSPLPKDIDQFKEYISAAYGTQTYKLRQLG